jgi:hypothetical protein
MTKSEPVPPPSVDNYRRHDPEVYRISTLENENGVQSILFNTTKPLAICRSHKAHDGRAHRLSVQLLLALEYQMSSGGPESGA